jgi:epoxyqueuosine reductase
MDLQDSAPDTNALLRIIGDTARDLGFSSFGVADTDIEAAGERLREWIEKGHHGEMGYLAKYGSRRHRPAELVPGTISCLSFTMEYLPQSMSDMRRALGDHSRAYIARYALGRDYHKYVRRRLQRLADRIAEYVGPFGYRVFTDSAPVMEKPLAVNAGLGWIGKHTNLINRDIGSWFFIGEIYTDLALPSGGTTEDHCGSCTQCMNVCPTGAIVAPYVLDARLCISYLTIENKKDIPEPLRPLVGNRVFGCDDCQLFCPWNRFAKLTSHEAFHPRHQLDDTDLATLFLWDERQFEEFTRGSALRRAGYEGWLRNLAVALGNAPTSSRVVEALKQRSDHESAMVRRHVAWALRNHDTGDYS